MVAPETVIEQANRVGDRAGAQRRSRLGACLESLVAQAGVSFEIIVVDDASTDRTREIAQSFPSSARGGCRPAACQAGRERTMPWLPGAKSLTASGCLFTDADTVHLPGSLARAVAEARQHGARLLSYSPEQEVHGFWEKAVMPVIFAELAATYRPSLVSDPRSPAAAANGQYILIAREAYDAIGGHAAVSGSLLEDVALAKAVKASGRKIFFRFGGDAVRTRMYRSFAQLREGWTKNLALLFPSPVAPGPAQIDGICADRRRRRRQPLRPLLRGHIRPALVAAVLAAAIYGFSSQSNSQGAFFLAGKCVVAGGPSALCVSFVAVQTLS